MCVCVFVCVCFLCIIIISHYMCSSPNHSNLVYHIPIFKTILHKSTIKRVFVFPIGGSEVPITTIISSLIGGQIINYCNKLKKKTDVKITEDYWRLLTWNPIMIRPENEKIPNRVIPIYIAKSAPSICTILHEKYMQNKLYSPSTYRKIVNGTLY